MQGRKEEEGGKEGGKRKRDVLSCASCRLRKLKCDRVYPICGRCRRGGNSTSCTYTTTIDEEKIGLNESGSEKGVKKFKMGPPPSVNRGDFEGMREISTVSIPERTLHRLEERLVELERVVLGTQGEARALNETMKWGEKREREGGSRELETNLFKGKGFRTQFYGVSCPTSLLAHFPEVRTLMTEIYPNSTLERLQTECRTLEKRDRSSASMIPTTELLSLVPERSKVDRLVKLHMDTFGRTHHILHLPSFWKDYEVFWDKPQDVSPGFVPLLLMVLATVHCTSNEPLTYSADGSTPRNQAVTWIQACDTWLARQSQKHRFIAMYQIMCLRILAASANCMKTKTTYIGVEAVLTYFKSAGMHRDPSVLEGKCSVFDGEMRRRLWFTVQEMELQASIDRGTSSALGGFINDCSAPLNINDEDLTIDCVKIPNGVAVEVYTDASFLHESSKSLPLRIALCSIVNSSISLLGFSDILHYEQQITDALSSIPRWTSPESTQASSLLSLQLLQFLVLIHTPNARRTGSSARYSRMACFSSAKTILDYHSALTAKGNVTLALVREDIFRAALTICHNAFLCTLQPGDIFFASIMFSFSAILEDAFKLLEERGMRRGKGLHQFWYVSAAAALIESKLEPGRAGTAKIEATERVARLYHRYLASWDKKPETQNVVSETSMPLVGSTSGAWNHGSVGNALAFSVPNQYIETGTEIGMGINIFDSSDWTLDNLWPMEEEFEALI